MMGQPFFIVREQQCQLAINEPSPAGIMPLKVYTLANCLIKSMVTFLGLIATVCCTALLPRVGVEVFCIGKWV